MKAPGRRLLIASLIPWVLAAGPAARAEPPAEPPAETEPPPAPAERAAEPDEAVPAGQEEAGRADETDAPPAAEGEERVDGEKSADDRATLKIECDLDCTVTVGLDPPVAVTAGAPHTVEIEPGAVRVQAYVNAAVEARTYEDVTVAAGERQRVRLKMTKALVELRKLEARERTYRDVDTRLMWPSRDNGVDVEWQEAIGFCDSLEHGGWHDWRLPTLDELESLEAMWSLRPYKTADPVTLTSCCTWSSDRIDEENAWNFNYRFRRPFRGHLSYSLSLRALCVRDGSEEIPENTRKNRRLAKREAKEKHREKLRRQAEKEKAAAEKAAAEEAEDDDPGRSW